MKYLDFFSLFDGDPAYIAFFSTFQFDPDFFERRLLRSATLRKARRIAVFMDARQWQELLNRDVHTRWLNRRYLVVPVHRAQGVFHPKLNLILTENGGQIQCGSNNLTRSGCSSNLELINSIPFEFDDEYADAMRLAAESLSFYERAAQDTDDEVGRIVTEWIEETSKVYGWLNDIEEGSEDQLLTLVHTYDGPIWRRIVESTDGDRPHRFFVVSPFHDRDGEICQRLVKQWPKAKVEFFVQQGYTNLPIKPLRKLPSIRLSEIINSTRQDSSRRVHAKLFAWTSKKGGGCLVGSANFTSAAFDGRNVEACLLLKDAGSQVDQLFDKGLTKRFVALDDFEPGSSESPESENIETPTLGISAAVLLDPDHVRVSYSHSLDETPKQLRLAIRTTGEVHPRKSLPIPVKTKAIETVVLPENTLADCHGAILASLIADLSDERLESVPVWIVQEERLTHEPGEGSSSSKGRIEETGEGLHEYLDELGNRDGASAVAEYLRHLNIRFNDGSGGLGGKRRFRIRVTDPFRADTAPDWLLNAKQEPNELEKAIYDFVDRHDKRKLRKHAELGNINGMENFLDIFTTLVGVLYRYYRRDVVKRGWLIGSTCTLLEVATSGRETEKEYFDGYLYALWDSLRGDVAVLQEVCDETNYCAEVRAALLIAQMVRYVPDEQPMYGKAPQRPRHVLEHRSKMVSEAIRECALEEPSRNDVRKALEAYRLFSENEIAALIAEL